VIAEMTEWCHRPLEPVYPVVSIDAIYVKIRDGQVTNRPVDIATGVTCAGERDILELWAATVASDMNEHMFVSADSCSCLRFFYRSGCR
jgi:transposase-like protein